MHSRTRLLEGHRAVGDAFAVPAATRAGMVLIGKTRTVQFAYGGGGHQSLLGNASLIRQQHMPGGSSSARRRPLHPGMVPEPLGTDTPGLNRLPCGAGGPENHLRKHRPNRGLSSELSPGFHRPLGHARWKTPPLVTQALMGRDPGANRPGRLRPVILPVI